MVALAAFIVIKDGSLARAAIEARVFETVFTRGHRFCHLPYANAQQGTVRKDQGGL
jgi:hypothetical protein